METTDKSVTLFQEIGKVLYAIAIADKTIHPMNMKRYGKLLKKTGVNLLKQPTALGLTRLIKQK